MPRILRARRSGEPGRITRSVETFTGTPVSADRETKAGVRRLFARNPAKHQDDPLGFTNDPDIPNPNAAPSPRIINGSIFKRQSITTLGAGATRVVNRGINRALKKR